MGQTDIHAEISSLLQYGVEKGLLQEEDRAYCANRLLAVLGASSFMPQEAAGRLESPAGPLGRLCDWAVGRGMLEDTLDSRDQFDTELMACLAPRPSEVRREFYRLYEKDREAATGYYYGLSQATNYIRTDRVKKDRSWTAPTPYGDMVVTINLSKPEKDPKAIAAAKNAPQSGYPKCALCRENEGYKGSANQAARGSHRLVPLQLCGEPWFLQYSPYVYYNEHCIVFSGQHRPMRIYRETFRRLLAFVEFLPHYFLGSNADLPIVGGSILSHDHFQGGRYEFPMAKAPLREEARFPGFPQVQAGVVNWPMSVLRLRSADQEALVELADRVLGKWRGWSDASAGILAYTGDTPHNTITPIARRRGGDFELDLVLRNNRTTPEHPLGLFHPHSQYHHVKKENIGLIEVMGLAILPPRLLGEVELLKQALSNPAQAPAVLARPEMEKHRAWYEGLRGKGVTAENAQTAVEHDVGRIFQEILGNAGVYKDDGPGREAFRRFLEAV